LIPGGKLGTGQMSTAGRPAPSHARNGTTAAHTATNPRAIIVAVDVGTHRVSLSALIGRMATARQQRCELGNSLVAIFWPSHTQPTGRKADAPVDRPSAVLVAPRGASRQISVCL
jgi:hypothetical protein